VSCEGAGARKGSSAVAQPGDVAARALNSGMPAAGVAGVTAWEDVTAPTKEAIISRNTNIRSVDREVIRSPFSLTSLKR
jgi:hypothetical protein